MFKSGLADPDGISDVLVDLSSGRVEVFYDSTRVKDLTLIASAITAVGYPATLKQTIYFLGAGLNQNPPADLNRIV